jgi:hypothetical protein
MSIFPYSIRDAHHGGNASNINICVLSMTNQQHEPIVRAFIRAECSSTDTTNSILFALLDSIHAYDQR